VQLVLSQQQMTAVWVLSIVDAAGGDRPRRHGLAACRR
jgi:hypothetical protein